MSTFNLDRKKPSPAFWLKAVFMLTGGALVIGAGIFFDFRSHLLSLLQHIEGMGFPGYGLFFAVYVAACVFFIPGSILTLGAGAIYGVVNGSLLVSLSSTIGATAAFLIGRHLARDWVAGKIQDNARFAAVDNAVGEQGWQIVALTRLSPIFPFALLNYAYGLTKVRLRDYFLASWLGMLPGTVMYVYLGSLAKSLSAVGTDCVECKRSAWQWGLYVLGLVATVAVTIVITRVAQRALRQKLPSQFEAEQT